MTSCLSRWSQSKGQTQHTLARYEEDSELLPAEPSPRQPRWAWGHSLCPEILFCQDSQAGNETWNFYCFANLLLLLLFLPLGPLEEQLNGSVISPAPIFFLNCPTSVYYMLNTFPPTTYKPFLAPPPSKSPCPLRLCYICTHDFMYPCKILKPCLLRRTILCLPFSIWCSCLCLPRTESRAVRHHSQLPGDRFFCMPSFYRFIFETGSLVSQAGLQLTM